MNITADALIEKIIFNIEVGGKKYNDVCANYDKKDKLTFGDIHHEDNDSWRLVSIGDNEYDFQIYGNDDSHKDILKSRLSIQLYEMVECHHSDHILCSLDDDVKITNVRIYTDQGMKRCRLLKST